MKKALVMLVTVVLSLPLLSFGGSDSIGHTKSAVGNSKSNNNSGTLTVAPSTTSAAGEQTGSNAQSTSTATDPVISGQASTQPSGINAPGFGTAVIDGVMSQGMLIADVMSSGEWDNAVKIEFNANLPGGGTTPATLYIMNDGLNLYLAVKITGSSFGSATQFIADFDNNNDGIMEDGEDGIIVSAPAYGSVMSIDTYLFNCPSSATDPANCKKASDTDPNQGIQPYGTNNVTVAVNNGSSPTIIELSKPLNSKDALHDFSLKPGNKVGFHFTLRFVSVDRSGTTNTDTKIPASGAGQITIASPVFTRVIDIKPGSRENSINRKSEGKIPVAILSTADFNAPQLVIVDRTSLTFGRTGDEQSLAFCNEGSEDVNGDGLPDLICHFYTHLAEFQQGDTIGTVHGRTTDGSLFTAKDSVRIVR